MARQDYYPNTLSVQMPFILFHEYNLGYFCFYPALHLNGFYIAAYKIRKIYQFSGPLLIFLNQQLIQFRRASTLPRFEQYSLLHLKALKEYHMTSSFSHNGHAL